MYKLELYICNTHIFLLARVYVATESQTRARECTRGNVITHARSPLNDILCVCVYVCSVYYVWYAIAAAAAATFMVAIITRCVVLPVSAR